MRPQCDAVHGQGNGRALGRRPRAARPALHHQPVQGSRFVARGHSLRAQSFADRGAAVRPWAAGRVLLAGFVFRWGHDLVGTTSWQRCAWQAQRAAKAP